MKSIVAFLLACWILGGSFLPGFGIDQSAHWGDLMHHYQQHRKSDPQLSVIDFLAMHYGADSQHHKHPNHSHHNLTNNGHSGTVYTLNVLRLDTPDLIQVSVHSKSTFFRKKDLYAFLVVFALINPPRW